MVISGLGGPVALWCPALGQMPVSRSRGCWWCITRAFSARLSHGSGSLVLRDDTSSDQVHSLAALETTPSPPGWRSYRARAVDCLRQDGTPSVIIANTLSCDALSSQLVDWSGARTGSRLHILDYYIMRARSFLCRCEEVVTPRRASRQRSSAQTRAHCAVSKVTTVR